MTQGQSCMRQFPTWETTAFKATTIHGNAVCQNSSGSRNNTEALHHRKIFSSFEPSVALICRRDRNRRPRNKMLIKMLRQPLLSHLSASCISCRGPLKREIMSPAAVWQGSGWQGGTEHLISTSCLISRSASSAAGMSTVDLLNPLTSAWTCLESSCSSSLVHETRWCLLSERFLHGFHWPVLTHPFPFLI